MKYYSTYNEMRICRTIQLQIFRQYRCPFVHLYCNDKERIGPHVLFPIKFFYKYPNINSDHDPIIVGRMNDTLYSVGYNVLRYEVNEFLLLLVVRAGSESMREEISWHARKNSHSLKLSEYREKKNLVGVFERAFFLKFAEIGFNVACIFIIEGHAAKNREVEGNPNT